MIKNSDSLVQVQNIEDVRVGWRYYFFFNDTVTLFEVVRVFDSAVDNDDLADATCIECADEARDNFNFNKGSDYSISKSDVKSGRLFFDKIRLEFLDEARPIRVPSISSYMKRLKDENG